MLTTMAALAMAIGPDRTQTSGIKLEKDMLAAEKTAAEMALKMPRPKTLMSPAAFAKAAKAALLKSEELAKTVVEAESPAKAEAQATAVAESESVVEAGGKAVAEATALAEDKAMVEAAAAKVSAKPSAANTKAPAKAATPEDPSFKRTMDWIDSLDKHKLKFLLADIRPNILSGYRPSCSSCSPALMFFMLPALYEKGALEGWKRVLKALYTDKTNGEEAAGPVGKLLSEAFLETGSEDFKAFMLTVKQAVVAEMGIGSIEAAQRGDAAAQRRAEEAAEGLETVKTSIHEEIKTFPALLNTMEWISNLGEQDMKVFDDKVKAKLKDNDSCMEVITGLCRTPEDLIGLFMGILLSAGKQDALETLGLPDANVPPMFFALVNTAQEMQEKE